MKIKDSITIGILTPRKMDNKKDAKKFLELLLKITELSPEFFGNFEPIKKPFSSIEEVIKDWKTPFLWKRKKNKVNGSIWFNNPGCHSAIYIKLHSKKVPMQSIIHFVKEISFLFESHLSYIHMITQDEVESSMVEYDMWYPIDIGITTHDLKKNIPNLCWCMIFGKPYVDLIGKKLLDVPGILTEKISNSQIYIQLTSDIDNIKKNYEEFDILRDKIKEYIGKSIFYNSNNLKGYMVPDFLFN